MTALQQKKDMAEWNAIGHVALKKKTRFTRNITKLSINSSTVLKSTRTDHKMQTFRNSLSDMSNGERGKGKLYGEREKLMRMYERMKNELQTYGNNIGFLSISSKGGGGFAQRDGTQDRQAKKKKWHSSLKIDASSEFRIKRKNPVN